jgi:hypothetical protein
MAGCSEQGLKPCHDALNVAITLPALNASMVEGFDMSLEANVDNLCDESILGDAIYAVSSDVDGDLGGDGTYAGGVYAFTHPGGLSVGSHELSLRVIGGNSTEDQDSITVNVEPNTPPTVVIASDAGTIVTTLDPAAAVVATVMDAHEPLDSLALSWTLNGEPYDGPSAANADGSVTLTIADQDPGCMALSVTVTDMLGQTGSDSADLIIYSTDEDLDVYRWWTDADGDGWGVESTETISCDPPSDSVAFGAREDCDDGNDTVHPGAADYCDDGIDSDCDSTTPSGCFPYGDVDEVWSDAYMEGEFYDVQGVGDINDDGSDDIAVGMKDRSSHLLYGPVRGEISTSLTYISERSGGVDSFRGDLGTSIDGGLDVNGDGIPDMLLGNKDWRHACQGNYTVKTGKSYLVIGGSGLSSGEMEDFSADGSYLESGSNLMLHNQYTSGCGYVLSNIYAVHLIPDMDGDGLADFAISSTYNDEDTYGSVWVFLSSDISDISSGLLDESARLRLNGPNQDDYLGGSIASADVDGDGLSDLIVSSAPDDSAGTVYVVYARDLPSTPSEMDIRSIASISFTGASPGDQAGYDLAGAGDLDGDGDEEFLIAAPGAEDGSGVVYLIPGFYDVRASYGLEDGFSSSTTPNAQGAVRFVGYSSDQLSSVAMAGDINNDGSQDILIGAPRHGLEANKAGAAYILYTGPDHWGDWWDPETGAPMPDIELAKSASAKEHTARIYANTAEAELGTSVDAAGDMNGDGIDDIVIGPGINGGTLRVFFGGGT